MLRQLLTGAVRLLHRLSANQVEILLQQQRLIRTGRHEEFNPGQRLPPRIITAGAAETKKWPIRSP